jgi:hypothetical protein
MPYTISQLRKDGPPFAMEMLLRCIKAGEPFVTYGQVAAELQHQLGQDRIFSTHVGEVAGSLMDQILEEEHDAPLINVLITRPNGIPGNGAGRYLARRYPRRFKQRPWDFLTNDEKIRVVDRERAKVFHYPHWDALNERIFLHSAKGKIRDIPAGESDYYGGRPYGGAAESPEHRRLKEWVAQNPGSVGLDNSYGVGMTEAQLLSGDEVDVVFSHGTSFRVVEVKSCRSLDSDFQRGLYQCVKYRDVKRAEHLPYNVDVQPLLVTERVLNPELSQRARLLGVPWKQVNVNKK